MIQYISLIKPRFFIGISVCCFLIVLMLFISPLKSIYAHSPELHQFRLVAFNRPFPAPSFSLEDLSGVSKTLESYRGQYVLLNFWATWCIPCLKEMPSMESLSQHFRDQKFTIVAISIDVEGKAKVEKFVKKLKLTFPILLDPENSSSKVYGVKNLPSSFLLNPEGKVIAAAKGEREWFSEGAVSYLKELINPS